MGFIMGKGSYLRDGWNILDFVVVLSAIFEFIPHDIDEVKAMKALRALRAIRPLRSINSIPSLKKLVKIMLISLPNLGNLVILLGYMIFIFAVIGLHQFVGGSYSRCRLTPEPF